MHPTLTNRSDMTQRSISANPAQLEELLHNLLLLGKHLGLYDQSNTVIEVATAKFMHSLETAHRAEYPVQFTVARDKFLVQGMPLNPKNLLFGQYAYRLFQHGVTSFTLTSELTTSSLYSFFKIISDHPSTTWDAGGIKTCLEKTGIRGILVTEMSQRDFLLVDAKDPDHELISRNFSQEFWDRFARSLLAPFNEAEKDKLAESDFNPIMLADEISRLINRKGVTSHEQEHVNRSIVRYVTTTQGNRQTTQRAEILLQLAQLINHLDDAPAASAIAEICKQPISEEVAREFFQQLSDRIIHSAYQQITSGQVKSPPRIMALISKLAGERQLSGKEESQTQTIDHLELSVKAQELLRSENLEQFVPPQYQNALNQVLAGPLLPEPLTRRLKKLKKSLEDFQIEQQITRMSIYLLQNNPDPEQLEALHQQLIRSMQFHVDTVDYFNLQELCEISFRNRAPEQIKALSAQIPHALLKQILDDASRLDKKYQPLISEVIKLIKEPFIRPLLERIATESNRSVRFFYLSHLKILGIQVAAEAAHYLNDSQWFVVRNMLLLLGELEAKEQLPTIRPLLNHSHPKVRQEALKTCLLLGDHQSLRQMTTSLASDDRQEVLNAIVLSRLVHNSEISQQLLTMLQQENLFNFDVEMKKALVQALAEQQNSRALKTFSILLSKRKLLHGRAYDQLKLEIIKNLGHYPLKQVRPVLQQLVDQGSPEAASQARQILKKLQQAPAKESV